MASSVSVILTPFGYHSGSYAAWIVSPVAVLVAEMSSMIVRTLVRGLTWTLSIVVGRRSGRVQAGLLVRRGRDAAVRSIHAEVGWRFPLDVAHGARSRYRH